MKHLRSFAAVGLKEKLLNNSDFLNVFLHRRSCRLFYSNLAEEQAKLFWDAEVWTDWAPFVWKQLLPDCSAMLLYLYQTPCNSHTLLFMAAFKAMSVTTWGLGLRPILKRTILLGTVQIKTALSSSLYLGKCPLLIGFDAICSLQFLILLTKANPFKILTALWLYKRWLFSRYGKSDWAEFSMQLHSNMCVFVGSPCQGGV